MEVIQPAPHAARAAAPRAPLHRSEGGGLALQVERHVQRAGVRVVRHRPQALEAAGARAEEQLLAHARHHALAVGELPGLGIDVREVLVAEVDRPGERPGRAVELPQDAQLAHAEHRPPAVVVDQDPLERLVHVVAVARNVLEEPAHLAGGRIEGQGGVAVESVAVGSARVPRPRLGLRGPVVDEAADRIVAARNPGVAAGPEQQRQVAPGVSAALSRSGDGRGAPRQTAGASVDADDVAGVLAEALAAAQTGHDRAVGDHRPARETVALLVRRHVGVPAHRAGARVEADDVRVDGVEDDQVLVDGEAAHLRGGPQPLVHLAAVLPEEVAGRRVERLHDVAGVRDVQHAVAHDRGRLRDARLEPPGPDEPERADVVAVDLVERAVAPSVQGAPPVEPVGRVRILQDLVGDRGEVPLLRRCRMGGDGRRRRGQEREETCARGRRRHGDLLGRQRMTPRA